MKAHWSYWASSLFPFLLNSPNPLTQEALRDLIFPRIPVLAPSLFPLEVSLLGGTWGVIDVRSILGEFWVPTLTEVKNDVENGSEGDPIPADLVFGAKRWNSFPPSSTLGSIRRPKAGFPSYRRF